MRLVTLVALAPLVLLIAPCPALGQYSTATPGYNPGATAIYGYGTFANRFGYGTRYGLADRFGNNAGYVGRFGYGTRFGQGDRFGYVPFDYSPSAAPHASAKAALAPYNRFNPYADWPNAYISPLGTNAADDTQRPEPAAHP